jgi:glycosyltransferase involved in cell wall biosynthesis
LITCKRFPLFKQALESFIANCEDINLIKQIILVDDNSDIAEQIMMKEALRHLNMPNIFLCKYENKGHAISMNIAWKLVETNYVLLLEDDWLNVKKDCYIKKAFEVFAQNDKIIQVQFRTNPDIMAVGQEISKTPSGLEYIEYKYEVNVKDGLRRPAWIGYTNNPSLIRFKELKENVGMFRDIHGFEWNYACRVAAKGYKVGYFPEDYFKHIGPGASNSAYAKNGTRR